MEQPSNLTDTTQIAVAKKMLTLENRIKGGTSWFFWIAGLSVLNSIIFFTGGSIVFVVGLGTTQLIDGILSVVVNEINSGAGIVVRVIGFGLDILFAGIFLACGVYGRKRVQWVIVAGMILYGLDGIISLLFGDWLGLFFHVFALAGLWQGKKAINELALLEKSLSTGDQESLQKLMTAKSPFDTEINPRRLIRLSLTVLIPLLLCIFILVMFIFNYK